VEGSGKGGTDEAAKVEGTVTTKADAREAAQTRRDEQIIKIEGKDKRHRSEGKIKEEKM